MKSLQIDIESYNKCRQIVVFSSFYFLKMETTPWDSHGNWYFCCPTHPSIPWCRIPFPWASLVYAIGGIKNIVRLLRANLSLSKRTVFLKREISRIPGLSMGERETSFFRHTWNTINITWKFMVTVIAVDTETHTIVRSWLSQADWQGRVP